MNDEIALITHHEAGHAVAALMTVDGDLDGSATVTLVCGRGTGNVNPARGVPSEPAQAAFIFYAGPWAEARVQWAKAALDCLGDTTDDGTSFRETVVAAFKNANLGGVSDLAMYNQQVSADPSIPGREPDWSHELERAWPIIQSLANALRDGLGSAEPAPHPYPELPGNHHLTMTSYRMPAGEVLALVQPLLEASGMWRSVS